MTPLELPPRSDELPRFDELFGPRWGVDMDALISELYAAGEGGPIQSPFDGSVLAFRNADLRALSNRPELGNTPVALQVPESMPNFRHHGVNHVFTMQPPTWDAMRKTFAPHFLPGKIHQHKPVAVAAMRDALAGVVGRGSIDLHADVSLPAAVRLWGTVYGLTEAEMDQVVELVPGFYSANYFEPTPEDNRTVEIFMSEFHHLVRGAIQRTIDTEPPLYLAEMAAEFDAVTVDKPESLAAMLASHSLDGFHSMAVALTSAVRELLVRPDQWALVQEQPKLVSNAFSEGMRLAPPTAFTNRFTHADVNYNGLHIPAGQTVTMVWIAGNRDPDVFEDPNRYDLFRRGAGQMTFGGGTHLCPGRNMARMFIETAFAELASTSYRVVAAGPTDQWVAQSGEYHLRRLPVAITAL